MYLASPELLLVYFCNTPLACLLKVTEYMLCIFQLLEGQKIVAQLSRSCSHGVEVWSRRGSTTPGMRWPSRGRWASSSAPLLWSRSRAARTGCALPPHPPPPVLLSPPTKCLCLRFAVDFLERPRAGLTGPVVGAQSASGWLEQRCSLSPSLSLITSKDGSTGCTSSGLCHGKPRTIWVNDGKGVSSLERA